MCEEKKISIIIPVYNVEPFIKKCLESVLYQMSESVEVIVVDDGSTDSSYQKCVEYSRVFTVLHKENGGLSSARNTGIDVAQGKYIMFLDSDDSLVPDSLPKIISLIDQGHSYDVIAAYPEELSESKIRCVPDGVYNGLDFINLSTRAGIFYVCAPFYIVSKQFIENSKLRFKEGVLHEDSLWTPLLLSKATFVYKSSIVFYSRYVREGSITQSKNNLQKRADSMITISRELRKEAKMNSNAKRMLNSRAISLYFDSVVMTGKKVYSRFEEFSFLQLLSFPCGVGQRVKSIIFLISPSLLIRIVNGIRHRKAV